MQKTQLLRFPLHTRFPPGDLQRQRACWGSQRRQRLVWRVALGGSGALPVALHATFTLLPGGLSLTATPATSWQMTQHPAYDSSPDFSPNLGSDPPPAYGTSPLLLIITQISVLFRAQYMSNYSKICIFQM